jgi:hypothetical protein
VNELTDEEHAEGPRVDVRIIIDVDDRRDDVLGRLESTNVTLANGLGIICGIDGQFVNPRFLRLAQVLLRRAWVVEGVVETGRCSQRILLLHQSIRIVVGRRHFGCCRKATG